MLPFLYHHQSSLALQCVVRIVCLADVKLYRQHIVFLIKGIARVRLCSLLCCRMYPDESRTKGREMYPMRYGMRNPSAKDSRHWSSELDCSEFDRPHVCRSKFRIAIKSNDSAGIAV